MNKIATVKNRTIRIINKSSVPEDPIHAKNTLEWLRRLKPDASETLQIATLGHDIERAIEERKVKRKDYQSYYEFKDAHALNSAKIMREIMKEHNMNKAMIEKVFFLVRHRENGGTKLADVLKNADSISFFHVGLPFYHIRHNLEQTEERCLWGLKRLPQSLRRIVAKFNYRNPKLNSFIKNKIRELDNYNTDSRKRNWVGISRHP